MDELNNEVRKAASMRNYGMFVEFQTSCWTGVARSTKAALDAEAASGAASGSVGAHKRLLAGVEDQLNKIRSCVNQARITHRRLTLPWTDLNKGEGYQRGKRILPNALWDQYISQMEEHRNKMKLLVVDFTKDYPDLVEQAKENLQELYNPDDYPDPEAIKGCFRISYDFTPIPEGTDFVGLPDHALKHLALKLEHQLQDRMATAMEDVWSRLYAAVEHIAERTSDAEQIKLTRMSLMPNLEELVGILQHMNVAEDPRLDAMCKLIKTNLARVPTKSLKTSESTRTNVNQTANAVLAKLSGWGVAPDGK